ncbi:collagen binding domain-containing protein [Nocardia sp. BSTN01]|uniref:MSCRAMM family protein n=1 Tax=Nocardia sp. BSTN01 TaxID=2783665 RepID=UPI001E5A13FC|nr:carboxypeptidase-like regulatory domain-containing protein [Nocardia sp. BSTN01]
MDAEHSSHSAEHAVASESDAVQRNGFAQTPRRPAVSGPVAFGRVHDSRGAALPDAVLTLISMSGRQIGRSLTDAEGYFELAAPEPGSYVLIASIDGRRPDASTVQLAHHPVPCDIVLTAMAGLAGTVSRGDDGTAIAGARVSALDARGEVLSSAATTDDGTFGLAELPEGDFTIAVSANGFHPTALPVRAGGSETPRLDVTLRPCARLHGVVRGRDGRPLPDALVTLTDWDGTVIDTMVTGLDGAYTFADLHDGTYTVVASGYAPVHTPVVVGADAEELNVELGHDNSRDLGSADQLTSRYSGN